MISVDNAGVEDIDGRDQVCFWENTIGFGHQNFSPVTLERFEIDKVLRISSGPTPLKSPIVMPILEILLILERKGIDSA